MWTGPVWPVAEPTGGLLWIELLAFMLHKLWRIRLNEEQLPTQKLLCSMELDIDLFTYLVGQVACKLFSYSISH